MKNEIDNTDLQQAISDISIIRQVLNNTDDEGKLVGITLKSNIVIQTCAFACALILSVYELMSGYSMSQTLMSSGQAQDLKIYGIGFMAAILLGVLVPLYFIVWRAAKHNGEEMNSYIARNFNYLRNVSLVSDLLIKSIVIALLILADKPEWIAVLLTVFIGDYLLQSRFFTFSTLVSIVLGMACIAVALVLFINQRFELVIPLAIFTVITAASLLRLVAKQQRLNAVTQ